MWDEDVAVGGRQRVAGLKHPEDEIQVPGFEIRGSGGIVEIDLDLVVASLHAELPADIEPDTKPGTVAHAVFSFGGYIFRADISPPRVVPTIIEASPRSSSTFSCRQHLSPTPYVTSRPIPPHPPAIPHSA